MPPPPICLGAAVRADPFPHQFVSSLLCPPNYQGLSSPSKPPQLQLQPQLLAQAAQQQYVPVSMVEQQTGRQVLLTQGPGWSNNRQMTLVPSAWQQLPTQHSNLQQSGILQNDGPSEWGRTLLVDPSAIQDQRNIFPVDLPEVYDAVGVSDSWQNSKRGNPGTSNKSSLFTLQVS